MDNSIHETGASIETFFKWGGYIAAAAVGFLEILRRSINKRKANKLLIKDNNPTPPLNYLLGIEINQLLIELRVESRADRAQIHLFQNGEHYVVSNTSIQRFSCAFEKVAPGIAPVAGKLNRCLISTYIDGLQRIVGANGGIAKITRDTIEDGMYKASMIDTGAFLQVGASLAWKGEVIGFLLLTYLDEDRSESECSFSALVEEGRTPDTDTKELHKKVCNGSCKNCHYRDYILRLEALLAKGE